MRLTFVLFLLSASLASATQYYVKTTGNDSLDGLSIGNAWLTIQKAANTMTAGDTVTISAGDYPETVQETTDGSSGSPITYLADGVVTVDQFRVDGEYIVLSGLTIDTPRQALWTANLFLTDAHNFIATNCTFGPMPLAFGTGFTFHASGVISNPAVNFTTMGFKANQPVWLAGYTETNGPGAFIYPFTNGFKVVTNGTVGTTTMTLTGISTNESPQWIAMYPGMDKEGYAAIDQLGSGTRATNVTITHSTFKSVWGQCINMNFNRDWLIVSNTFDVAASFKMIIPSGTNITLRGNFFRYGTNFIYGSSQEIGWYSHEVDQYAKIDWIFGQIHPSAAVIGNFVAEYNWFHGRAGDLSQFAAGSGQTNNTWRYNVFVGVSGPPNGAQDGYRWQSNTFFKVGFGTAETTAILAQSGKTVEIVGNIFYDIGDHSSTNTLPYSVTSSTGVVTNYNFVAQAETLGFMGYAGFAEANGINGGDPKFVDMWNPLGPDGLPFTADDGLRLMTNSPARGLGALSVIDSSSPRPHFVWKGTYGWKDGVAEAFDSAWVAQNFWERTSLVRPWDTPEDIGDVPAVASFDATESISGTWSDTNYIGAFSFVWTFSDGSVVTSRWPTNSHTFLTAGTHSVKLTVSNTDGESASVTNWYRVGSGTPAVDIWHVKTSGNDTTGDGSFATPYLTIAKAVSVVAGGDYIAVHPGTFAAYTDVNRNVAGASTRITIVGYGATHAGFKIRYPYWTIDGFTLNYSPTDAADAAIYLYNAADDTWVLNNTIRDTPESIYGVELLSPGSFGALDGVLNVKVFNNTFTNVGHICVNAFNSSNLLVDANIAINTWGEGDFVRPMGVNATVSRNYCTNLNNGATGGHADFLQFPQPGSYQFIKDILVERNWVSGGTNGDDGDGAIAQMASDAFGSVNYSNVVFRNNVFDRVRGTCSDSIDGLKFYNNLFYDTPRDGGNATSGGGVNGSSYGTLLFNNIFFNVTSPVDTAGWYYNDQDSGNPGSNTTVNADFNLVYPTKQQAPPDNAFRWAVTGTEANGINGTDPSFANAAGKDFRLTTSIAGTNLSGAFTTDFFGMTRSAWTLGPFEGEGDAPPAGGGSSRVSGLLQGSGFFRGSGFIR